MTIKILNVVNSAAFGFNTEISQIPAAVRILGFNQLSHLISGLSILNLSDNVIKAEFNYKRFWEHSLAVVVGARVLIKYSNSSVHLELEDAFICGLLHDIGKIIENQYFNREFRQAISLCKKKQINLTLTEDAILGFNHQHMGALIIRHWKLPKLFEYVVSHHNDPLANGDLQNPLVLYNNAVHIANSIAKSINLGSARDPFVSQINYDCWNSLNIPIEKLPKICKEIRISTRELYASIF